MFDISGEAPDTIADYDMAKKIAETLHSHYPGHLWGVKCSHEQGIATVLNLRLSGRWGFIIHLKNIQNDPSLKSVIRSGGEILERYRLKRGEFDQDSLDQLSVDFAGLIKADT